MYSTETDLTRGGVAGEVCEEVVGRFRHAVNHWCALAYVVGEAGEVVSKKSSQDH
jgi:hypothetical protein